MNTTQTLNMDTLVDHVDLAEERTDVAACSGGQLDLVLGLDGPCNKRKTMTAEAGTSVAAAGMGQVMAAETANMSNR
uniref:Uncharacterized protein n=1 Tax=Arundo donax TaxID=35708 RepID=A0A0A8XZP0_ARUDO